MSLHSSKQSQQVVRLADTGCSRNIFNANEQIVSTKRVPRVTIQGVSGMLSTELLGYHPLFGEGLLVPGYNGPTLISFGELCRSHVLTSPKAGMFLFIPRKKDDPAFIVKLNDQNLFPIRAVQHRQVPQSGGAVAFMVQEAKVKLVWTLHEILAHASEKAICAGVENGEYKSLGLTTADIQSANLGDCIACKYGKLRAGHRSTSWSRNTFQVRAGDHQHADLVFVRFRSKHLVYLIAVDGATRFVYSQRLQSKDPEEVARGIRGLVAFHQAYRATRNEPNGIIHLHSDVDSSITKLAKAGRLRELGIEHVHTGADVHEKVAERNIQTIRNKARAVLIGLNYQLPADLLPELWDDVILSHNQTPNSLTGGLSPWSLVTSELVDGSRFQVPFGCVGIFHNPKTGNSLESKGQLGIVIGRQARSRALQVLLLGKDSSERKVTRDKVVPLPVPLPDDVKRTINELSNGDVTALNDDSLIMLETPTRTSVSPIEVRDQSEIQGVVSMEEDAMEISPTPIANSTDKTSLVQGELGDTALPVAPIKFVKPMAQPGDEVSIVQGRGTQTVGSVPLSTAKDFSIPVPRSTTRVGSVPLVFDPMQSYRNHAAAENKIQSDSDLRHPEPLGTAPQRGHQYDLRPRLRAALASAPAADPTKVRLEVPFLNYADTGMSDVGEHERGHDDQVTAGRANDRKMTPVAEGVKVSVENQHGDCRHVVGGVIHRCCSLVGCNCIPSPGQAIGDMSPKLGVAERVHELGLLAFTAFGLAGWAAPEALSEAEKSAALTELKQLDSYGVFGPVDASKLSFEEIRAAIPTVMLVNEKYAPDGTYSKTKGRLVIKGYKDTEDVGAVDSPTVCQEVIMIALNVATSKNYDIDIFDVRAAFLEAMLDRPNVLAQIDQDLGNMLADLKPELNQGRLPDGCLLVRLKKALYGLKEAPLRWYETLCKCLVDLGFTRSRYDKCLFLRNSPEGLHYVLVHVDDILSSGPRTSMDWLRNGLHHRFKEVSENINPHHFNYLGMTAKRDRNKHTIELTQTKYIDNIIQRLELTSSQVSSTPCNEQLFVDESKRGPLETSLIPMFTSLVMLMLYVTKSRPDIKVAVIYLTTKLKNPTVEDWFKMIKIARYLNGTRDLPLRITGSSLNLVGSADAAFAVHKDMKSHTGSLLWFGDQNAPILSGSRKQSLVTRSSTEAELVALDSVSHDAVWLRKVLQEMGLAQDGPTIVQQDNKSCILMAERGYHGKNSRAVDIKYFWVSERVHEGELKLEYVQSNRMLADGLTKALGTAHFCEWRDRILNLTKDEDGI